MKASGQSESTGTEAWWVTRTPAGPATLRLALAEPEMVAEAWGAGSEWALEQAPHLVGSEDHPEDFDPPSGIVRDLHRRSPGLRIGRTGRVFDAVLPAILGQKVTNREARLAGIRLVRNYGEPAPGPTALRLLPDAAVLAGLSYWDLHPLGIERKRADILTGVARRVGRLEEIAEMDRDSAYRRLLAFRGIGPWTAGHVMGIARGDADAVPTGDFHLPNTVAYALAGEARADDDRMLELLEPYRGHRRRVMLLLKGAGIKAPKFGPRHALRSIENI
jgi:3-methyladenine DNA glycosylase/8-oxoguanine DNA glycosylase